MPAEKGKIRFPQRSVTGCIKHIPEQAPEKVVAGQHKLDSKGLGFYFCELFISFCFDLNFFHFFVLFYFWFCLEEEEEVGWMRRWGEPWRSQERGNSMIKI